MMEIFDEIVGPAAQRFKPDIILVRTSFSRSLLQQREQCHFACCCHAPMRYHPLYLQRHQHEYSNELQPMSCLETSFGAVRRPATLPHKVQTSEK